MAETKKFNEGDVVTVSRGKYASETGKIVGLGAEEGTYGVKLDSDVFVVLKASALKAPAEKTITERELQELISEHGEFPGDLVTAINERTGMNLTAPEISPAGTGEYGEIQ